MTENTDSSTSSAPPTRRKRGCLRTMLLVILLFVLGFVLLRILILAGFKLPVLKPSVAVLRIEGPINESTRVVRALRAMRRDSKIKAVVLRLDTPGGLVGASEEIYREVVRLRDVAGKPVVASMGNVAASGGYYIAVATNEIVANSGTLTGSIGVIGQVWNVEDVLHRFGVQRVTVKSGEHKDTGSPFRQMPPEDFHLMQGVVFDLYRQFVRTVLEQRHLQIERAWRRHPERVADILSTSTTKRRGAGIEWEAFTTGSLAARTGATTETETALRTMADGRIYSGEQALDLGLIDRIGTLEDAIERAGVLGGLGSHPPVVDRRPRTTLPALLGMAARQFWSEFSRGGRTTEYRAPEAY